MRVVKQLKHFCHCKSQNVRPRIILVKYSFAWANFTVLLKFMILSTSHVLEVHHLSFRIFDPKWAEASSCGVAFLHVWSASPMAKKEKLVKEGLLSKLPTSTPDAPVFHKMKQSLSYLSQNTKKFARKIIRFVKCNFFCSFLFLGIISSKNFLRGSFCCSNT